MLDFLSNTIFRFSKALRLFPVMALGLIILAVGTTAKSEIQIYVISIGGLLVIFTASVEMFTYLQESRRRFMRDRAFIERQYKKSDQKLFADLSSSHTGRIRLLSEKMQERLREEVNALGTRANVNLIIGNAIS
jgi:hypothetical protein